MLVGMTAEEYSACLDSVAAEVLTRAGLEGPPVDACELARRLGIAVAEDRQQTERARYVRLRGRRGNPPRPTVYLRPDPRLERRHWALAHEIGEHVAHRVFADLAVDPREVGPTARESVANHLAGRILLPGPWLLEDARACGWDLLVLKGRYATASHELIARRMLDFCEPVIVSVFDQGRVYFRRSNVAGRVPPPSAEETACWQAAHRRNRPQESIEGTCRIQAWPVHEPGWKREIVRREVSWEGVD